MTFSGDLRGISLADVFQNISANQGTGTLGVRWRQCERYVRFEGGAVAGFSLGVGKGLPIQDHLYERGYLDDKQVEKLIAKRKRSRKAFGRLAVELGFMAEEDLVAAWAQLIEEQVFELMQLKEAEFSFIEGDPPARVFGSDQRSLQLRLDVGPLLMEGARRRDEYERIQKIVTSDDDLFVTLEGWEDLDLDEVGAEIAPMLDGRTPVAEVRAQFYLSRFEVLKSICDLVHLGAARPCTAEEIELAARDAVDAGDDDGGIRLMERALELERNNRELQHQLAELLVRVGRVKDAATEYAKMGYSAAQAGEHADALKLYARAMELDPSNLPLHERRLDLLRETEDYEALSIEVLQLVDILVDMGLADRARTVLVRTVEQRPLNHDVALLERLGHVESALGHWEESARIFVKLGDRILPRDDARGLELLRLALDQSPDDEALAARIDDIETGRQARRRRRRRRVVLASAATVVAATAGVFTGFELMASRGVARALSASLGDLRDGRAIAGIVALQQVEADYAWLPSGRAAGVLVERLVNLQFRAIDELHEAGEFDAATRLLTDFTGAVGREDVASTISDKTRRIEKHRQAVELVAAADAAHEPTQTDLDAIAELADPELFDFLVARVADVESVRVRQAMLRALLKLDDPRCYVALAKLYVRGLDRSSKEICRTIFARAKVHRSNNREPEWEAIYPELEAMVQPSAAARDVLRWLRHSPASTPNK